MTDDKVGELFASGLSLHFNDIFCIFTTKTCMLLLSTVCIRVYCFYFTQMPLRSAEALSPVKCNLCPCHTSVLNLSSPNSGGQHPKSRCGHGLALSRVAGVEGVPSCLFQLLVTPVALSAEG